MNRLFIEISESIEAGNTFCNEMVDSYVRGKFHTSVGLEPVLESSGYDHDDRKCDNDKGVLNGTLVIVILRDGELRFQPESRGNQIEMRKK